MKNCRFRVERMPVWGLESQLNGDDRLQLHSFQPAGEDPDSGHNVVAVLIERQRCDCRGDVPMLQVFDRMVCKLCGGGL